MKAALRPVTIRDVARQANVSVASVSRALNGGDSVTETTRQRIIGVAQALNYVPHTGARSLSTRRTDTIGIVLPELHGEFFSEIIRGADQAARERGLHLLVSSSHGDPAEATAAIRSMRGRVDGLMILSPHVDRAVLAGSLTDQQPTVLINTPVEDRRYPSLRVDNRGGAQAVVRHLIGLGRRSIVHIAGPDGNIESAARRLGYLDALAAARLEPWILEGDFSGESGERAGRALAEADAPPDAVFAANDMMAVFCIRAMQAAGLHCPADVAVAGFDDIPLSRLVTPTLTTARVRITDLGRRALERLVEVIDRTGVENAPEIIQPELVVRASSTAQQAAAS